MGKYANFYNSRNGDRVYNADSMSEWLLPFFTTGVFNNCFAITANSDMSVTVDGGYVNIKGKTKYFENPQTFTLEKASGTLARIDNVILRRDDTERDFYIYIETGGFSKNPVAPEIVRSGTFYDLKLGEIYVGVGAIKVTQENITDTRMNSEVCGWVMSTVKEIDFSQITAQFEAFFGNYKEEKQTEFEQWFNNTKNRIESDAANKLQEHIEKTVTEIADDIIFQTTTVTTDDVIKDNAWNISGAEIGDCVSDHIQRATSAAGYFMYTHEIKKGDILVLLEEAGYLSKSNLTDRILVLDSDYIVLETELFETLDNVHEYTFTKDGYLYFCAQYPASSDITPLFQLKRRNPSTADLEHSLTELSEKVEGFINRSSVLWTGLATSGSIEFGIPREYYHANYTHITLLIECAPPNDAYMGDRTALVSLKFPENPGANAHYSSNIYTKELVETNSTDNVEINVAIELVPDSRYSVCTVTLPDSSKCYISCISALVPEEV